VQYNNAGAFAGMSGTAWDDTNRSLAVSGATLTTSAPIMNLSQTWAGTSGTVFNGIKLNITDTTSSALSAALEVQYGGLTYARIGKGASGYSMLWLLAGGTPTAANSTIAATSGGTYFQNQDTNGFAYLGNSNAAGLGVSNNIAKLASGVSFGFASGGVAGGTLDTILVRDAANILAQRNGVNSQAFRVYNTYTDASNYERGIFEWYSNTLYIGTQNAGSGSARNLQFIVGGNAIADYGITYAGAFNFTSSTAAGGAHFINNTATLYTGCAYFFAPNTTAGGNTAMFIGVANTTRNSFSLSFTYAGSGSTSNAIVFQFNGIAPPALSINSAGLAAFGDLLSTSPALKPSSTTLQVRLGNDSAFTAIQGKLTTDTAYTAGVLVPTGYITIYDSTGTAYRVPCLV